MTHPSDPAGTAGQPGVPTGGEPLEAQASSGARFEQRMETFGHEVEDAAGRISRDPGLRAGVDVAARIWGLILVAVGLWFFAEFTLGYDLPSVPWRDLWPAALVILGGAIVIRGVLRRT